ncbi:MAG: ABC-type microcin C transport system duplicated ATPase subunit YejF [Paracoccaceae bacterium]|jgi:ABC-type microcin C transport system duplicated ATPase subunit YejF
MNPILSLRNVSKTFGSGDQTVHAVRDVSFDVILGECLAVVGESGSGKTTLANMILGVFGQSGGEIWLDGKPLPLRRTLQHRRAIQLVQQNPLSSLNPKRSVGDSVRLGLDVYGIGEKSDRWSLVEQALQEVGLEPDIRKRAPAALSGGQRQRVAIARALACQSRLVVLDEPTSALDVLVQARVLRLLNDLRRDKGLSYVFITHDLSVVRNVADRVAVFKAGHLVECAPTKDIFETPQQSYTKQLIGAIPVVTEGELQLRNKLAKETS